MKGQGVSAIAGNPTPFQPGLSLPAFLEQYGTEAQCRAVLYFNRRYDLNAMIPRFLTGIGGRDIVINNEHLRLDAMVDPGEGRES